MNKASWFSDDRNWSKESFVIWNAWVHYRTDTSVNARGSKRKRHIDGAFYLGIGVLEVNRQLIISFYERGNDLYRVLLKAIIIEKVLEGPLSVRKFKQFSSS